MGADIVAWQDAMDFLQDPENRLPRKGAIRVMESAGGRGLLPDAGAEDPAVHSVATWGFPSGVDGMR
jgi:hypothetical protein